jgi:hypothetical protein
MFSNLVAIVLPFILFPNILLSVTINAYPQRMPFLKAPELTAPKNFSSSFVSIMLQVAGYSYSVDLSAAINIGDYNGNGISDLMIKFQRQPVVNNLKTIDYSTLLGKSVDVNFVVSGSLIDGTSFGCSDTLSILKK